MIAKLDSWLKVNDSSAKEILRTARSRVYDLIRSTGPLYDRLIAELLHWDINSVTPRRNELVKEGKVREVGSVYDSETDRTVTLWGIKGSD